MGDSRFESQCGQKRKKNINLSKKKHKINRHVGEGTTNKRVYPTLGNVHLPQSQFSAQPLLYSIPNCNKLEMST